ncbi:MAG: hypothetical protein GY869_32595, partial [Planctomycetes bacterium]|nr:hypothetical protein [Planctomycetota bacterium]
MMWLGLVLIIVATVLIRVRLLAAPLERDEGEYAYAGQLILQGIAPYDQVYNMKMPGIYAAYALIMAVFGQTHQAIHLGLLIVNVITSLLLFLIARRLFNPLAAIATAGAWAVMSLSPTVQGIFANAEHFVVPFALGGILLLLIALDKQKTRLLFVSGILLGIGFMMKQHGAGFILFGGFYLLVQQCRSKPINIKSLATKVTLFSAGIFLPYILTCGILAAAGTFEKFWFWTFSYAREYVTSAPISRGWSNFSTNIFRIMTATTLLWITAGVGLGRLILDRTVRRQWGFVVGFLFFGLVAVSPGFFFRPHYFILLLPAIALCAGIGVDGISHIFKVYRSTWFNLGLPLFLVLLVSAQALYSERNFFFKMNPDQACRSIYKYNPFVESLEIAHYIREHTDKEDRIAVIGSEPQIYFYSKRMSATGYIYTYALMEDHSYARTMQEEMISQIENAQPKYLIIVSVGISWLRRE